MVLFVGITFDKVSNANNFMEKIIEIIQKKFSLLLKQYESNDDYFNYNDFVSNYYKPIIVKNIKNTNVFNGFSFKSFRLRLWELYLIYSSYSALNYYFNIL